MNTVELKQLVSDSIQSACNIVSTDENITNISDTMSTGNTATKLITTAITLSTQISTLALIDILSKALDITD